MTGNKSSFVKLSKGEKFSSEAERWKIAKGWKKRSDSYL